MEQLAKGLRDPRESVELCFVDDTKQVDFEVLDDEIMSARGDITPPLYGWPIDVLNGFRQFAQFFLR